MLWLPPTLCRLARPRWPLDRGLLGSIWLALVVCLARLPGLGCSCAWLVVLAPHGSPVRTGFQLRCGSGLECGGGSDLSQAHRLSAAVKGPTGPFSGLSSFL
ncbi:unnamed protein product [Dicrocoelium dendriticum]|nr:unnamed protein product [Dicrocoelium dendriticum]